MKKTIGSLLMSGFVLSQLFAVPVHAEETNSRIPLTQQGDGIIGKASVEIKNVKNEKDVLSMISPINRPEFSIKPVDEQLKDFTFYYTLQNIQLEKYKKSTYDILNSLELQNIQTKVLELMENATKEYVVLHNVIQECKKQELEVEEDLIKLFDILQTNRKLSKEVFDLTSMKNKVSSHATISSLTMENKMEKRMYEKDIKEISIKTDIWNVEEEYYIPLSVVKKIPFIDIEIYENRDWKIQGNKRLIEKKEKEIFVNELSIGTPNVLKEKDDIPYVHASFILFLLGYEIEISENQEELKVVPNFTLYNDLDELTTEEFMNSIKK